MFIHLCGFAVNWTDLTGCYLSGVALECLIKGWHPNSPQWATILMNQQHYKNNNYVLFKPMWILTMQYFLTQCCLQSESEMTEKRTYWSWKTEVCTMRSVGFHLSLIQPFFFYMKCYPVSVNWQLLTVLHRFNLTVSALKSYQSDTLSSQFPVFHLSSWWSQWRPKPGAVPVSRMLPSFPSYVISILYLSSSPGSPPDSTVPSAFTDTHNLCFSIFIHPS